MASFSRRDVVASALTIPFVNGLCRAAEPDTIRFGMLYPNLVSVIHAIAKSSGAYERQNLKVLEVHFRSGQATAGVEQLWRGNLDFYMGGAPEIPPIRA